MEKKNRLKWITTLRKIRINRSMTKYTLALFFPFRKQKKKHFFPNVKQNNKYI